MRKSVIIVVTFILIGCNSHRSAHTPGDVLANVVYALNTRDVALFMDNMDQTRREALSKGNRINQIFDTTQGVHFTAGVISVDTDGNVANIGFWLKTSGKVKDTFSRIDAQFYKEGDSWKCGPITAVNGKKL